MDWTKIGWHYLCQEGRKKNAHFRAHYLFWPKNFLAQNNVNQENYKNSGFNGNCPKPTLFFGKKCFWQWKSGFYCVFKKLCFPENTIFIMFSTKLLKNKTCILKKRKFMKNCGLFLNMANGVFWVWFSEVLILRKFVFGVTGIVSSVK